MDGFMAMPDIAGLSTIMHQGTTLSRVGTAVLAKSMDVMEEQGDAMVKMMEQSVNPGLGANFDVRV